MSEAWLYELRDVKKAYGGRPVLQIHSLEVYPGEVLGLVGPTGAGKSTLLRLLSALEPPTAGHVRFGAHRLNGQRLPVNVQRRLTMVFQRPLMLHATVRANVEYGLWLRGDRQRGGKVQRILERLGLMGLASRSAATLSGGQTQLVALARALAIEPDVLLLDEPTANLDPASVALVEEVLVDYQRRRKATFVWATHNIFQARRTAQRVAFLLDGRLVEVAPTREFFETPSDRRTEAFVQGRMVY